MPFRRHQPFQTLTEAALRCDLTSVSCIGWTGGAWQFTFPSASAGNQKQMVDRWFAAEFANLLAQMDAVQEGDGTMLDHSIVVLANQMADGFW